MRSREWSHPKPLFLQGTEDNQQNQKIPGKVPRSMGCIVLALFQTETSRVRTQHTHGRRGRRRTCQGYTMSRKKRRPSFERTRARRSDSPADLAHCYKSQQDSPCKHSRHLALVRSRVGIMSTLKNHSHQNKYPRCNPGSCGSQGLV